MQAFVPTEKTTRFTSRSNVFSTAHLAMNVHHRFVEVGSVWGRALRDDLPHVLKGHPSCLVQIMPSTSPSVMPFTIL